ncbi:MAG: AraC family transcriptional regulator [Pseudomonadota bacterium]
MIPVQKALWFVETHFADELTLAEVADAVGVTPYHLTRAFAAATGWSLMKYVRARRLSEAAKTLARGAPDILSIAISVGYGSHEAFTRAFRDQFGVAPNRVRDGADATPLKLTEPIMMNEALLDDLAPPRFEDGRARRIAGLMQRYDDDASAAGIPAQWQRFAPHIGQVDGQQGGLTYGVCKTIGEAGGIDYLAGVEVSASADLPPEFETIDLAPQRYAVFRHEGHISEIRRTWRTIFEKWLPASGEQLAGAPDFELYSEDFDPVAGTGDIEIWLPIAA